MTKSIGINIGASKEALEKIHKCIMEILNADKAESVTIKALDTLSNLASVNNTVVQNCNIGYPSSQKGK